MSGATGQPPESGAGNAPAQAQRGWPGFWPWLATTLVLLLLIAAALWHLSTRAPQIVEVVGDTPPPAEPDPELVAKAAELRQKIALRQSELEAAILALDPPRCEAPKVPDLALLDKVREAEADNLRRWRALLVPVAGTLPQSTPPAEAGGQTPSKRQSAAQPASGPIETLSSEQLRRVLEQSSVIILGLPPKGGTGLSTGTGFFISPTTLVTNRHVIEAADPKSIYVTSRSFRKVQPVRLTARSAEARPGSPDFAVLELESGAAPDHVSLSSEGAKLSSVVAAGYPGLALKTDSGFRNLLQGDLTAAPDLNMNRGEIRSVRKLDRITQIVHTADVLQGYSGGPLMDACGRVIGVNTFIQVDQTQAAKLNNAIAVTDLVAFLGANGIAAPLDQRPCPDG